MPIDTQPGQLRALDLRYVLTAHLHELGPLSVEQLISELTDDGFDLTGRPSQTISDALRLPLTIGSGGLREGTIIEMIAAEARVA